MESNQNNRREFLKAGSAALAATAFPSSASSYAQIMGANDRVKVGVVGCGDRMKGGDLPAFFAGAKDLNFQIVAVSDIWNRRREVSWPDGTGAFASPWICRVSAPSGHKFGHKFFDLLLGRRTYDMWNEGTTFHEAPVLMRENRQTTACPLLRCQLYPGSLRKRAEPQTTPPRSIRDLYFQAVQTDWNPD